jgi:thiol-disulfide isomerase/thioredoxin
MTRTLIILFSLMFISVHSQGINFEKTLESAFEKAQKEGKLVFIEYYNSDCTVCKKLAPLLLDQKLGDYYNQHFVSYQMNTKNKISDFEKALLNQNSLYFESVPFFVFFDVDKNYLHHSGVQQDVDYLLEIARTALLPAKRKGSLEQKYNSGDRTVRTLYAYADLLVVQKNWKKQAEVAQALFEHYPKKDLGTQKSYIILKNVVYNTENGFFLYWINHMSDLNGMEKGSKSGQEIEVLEKIILKELASPHIKKWPEDKKNQMKKWIVQVGLTDKPEVYFE